MKLSRNTRGVPRVPLLATVVVGLFGCAADPGAARNPVSGENDPELREWYDVYHIRIEGGQRHTSHVGYVYKRIRGDDHVYFVRDLKDDADLGFLLEDFETYRFTREFDGVTGRFASDREFLGSLGLEGGVHRLLGLTTGTVELVKVPGSSPPDDSSSG